MRRQIAIVQKWGLVIASEGLEVVEGSFTKVRSAIEYVSCSYLMLVTDRRILDESRRPNLSILSRVTSRVSLLPLSRANNDLISRSSHSSRQFP